MQQNYINEQEIFLRIFNIKEITKIFVKIT